MTQIFSTVKSKDGIVLPEVKLNDGYLEFHLNGSLIYDFPATHFEKFKYQLMRKQWFSKNLQEICTNILKENLEKTKV